MASYYPSFNYKGLNSLNDKNLIVVAFDADEGEMDTFLGMDPIYTEKYDGTRRIDYGAKFNSVATVKISVVKANRSDFTVSEVRDFLKWTTGARNNSYLDLLIDGEVRFSFLGRVTNAYQQKLDARTIGLSIEFTSVSPWAYSPQQKFGCSFGQKLMTDNNGVLTKGNDSSLINVDNNGTLYNGTSGGAGLFQITGDGVVYIDNSVMLQLDNLTDDIYSYVNLDMTFINNNCDDLIIKNQTLYEESNGEDGITEITGMVENEVIKLSAEQFIISDVAGKIFGDNFNFVWPKLLPGINKFVIRGTGGGFIEFSYRYPIKLGDCAIDIYSSNDCGDYSDNNGDYSDNNNGSNNNNIIVGTLAWENITNKPTTRDGYNIRDVYTKTEVNEQINGMDLTIDEQELNDMLENILN